MQMNFVRYIRTICFVSAVSLGAMAPLAAGAASAADGSSSAAQAIVLPKPLSDADAERYRVIFALQEKGDWKKADALIAKLHDRLLMGHVLAQRYLHPTAYRSTYKELKAWMDEYADHPDAPRLYTLALRRRPANWRRPKAPVTGGLYVPDTDSIAKIKSPPGKRLSKFQRRKVAAYKRQIRWQLRKGWTKAVKQFIQSKEAGRLFSDFDMDEAKARLGAGYFAAGRDEWAVKWAGEASARSGRWLPEANWTAGLASWRLGRLDDAARHFEAVLVPGASDWVMSAGAFWAARAHLVGRRPERVGELLGRAAAYPRTFYGMLARHMLGLKTEFTWQIPELEGPALGYLKRGAWLKAHGIYGVFGSTEFMPLIVK